MRFINPHKIFVGSFVPNWLMCRTEVSPGAKLLYGRLCQHAGKDGTCYPGQDTLAAELGVGERQVRHYLTELVGHSLLAVKRLGLGRTNRYLFPLHPWMTDADAAYVVSSVLDIVRRYRR